MTLKSLGRILISGTGLKVSMKCFHSFRLDAANHCLWHGYDRVPIAPKAFDVLRHLVENPDRLVTQDELLDALWPDTYVNPEILRKYILDIRKVLGDRPNNPKFIETVMKRGYRFIAPVTGVTEPEGAGIAGLGESVEGEASGSQLFAEKPLPSNSRRAWEFATPFAFALLAIVGLATYFYLIPGKRSSLSKDTSIAVLPFADMSPEKDQEYFSDGLTEELINDLARVPRLKVVARSSAFQFKGKNEDLRGVARKLGVANVLEGSIRRDGDRVRITAELIKADDGFQLWSETYDRQMGDLLAAQDEVATAVTGALQLKLLTAGNSRALANPHVTNSEVYQDYLQGQYYLAKGQDKADLEKALSFADDAIKLDPDYAGAWAQRSLLLEKLANVALIENVDGFRRARESAEKAIKLDPNLAASYLALDLIQIDNDWDWDGADASLKKAALLEPGSAAIAGNRAYLARTIGNVDEAIELYKQAIALDPLRANLHLAMAYELYLAGRHEEAMASLQKAEELNPRLSSLHLTRGKVLFSQGHLQEALNEIEKESGEWEKLSGEALVYHLLGRHADSDRALQKLIATHQNDCAYQIAEAYAFRGETEKAFRWLERAIRQRDPGTPELRNGPLVKSLRQDPRYTAILEEIHLPK
jgi:TolB-like protein/DNA-binding winged helix-turn-helix (wHTH) protein